MPNGQIITEIGSRQLLLLDGANANVESPWMKWAPYHRGSLQITSTGSMVGTVTLYGSNDLKQPASGYKVVIGGTAHTGDVIDVSLAGSDFAFGQLDATYTVQAGDTLALIAAGVASAINAALAQAAIEYANSIDSFSTSSLYATVVGGTEIDILSQYQLNPITVRSTVTGTGATTTATASRYGSSSGFALTGLAPTAVGITPIDVVCQWIKAVLSGYSSGVITAIVNSVNI